MLNLLLMAFTWVFSFTLPPVESEQILLQEHAVLTNHVGGLVTVATECEGFVVIAFGGRGGSDISGGSISSANIGISILPDGGGGEEPLPTFNAEWKDAAGVLWRVITPIVSTTPAGMRRAADMHDAAVAIMKQRHPPV